MTKKVCPGCGGTKFIKDRERGEIVCKDCGREPPRRRSTEDQMCI